MGRNSRLVVITLALLISTMVVSGTAIAGPPPKVAITLTNPASGYVIPQNNTAIGCTADPNRGSGFQVVFNWSATGINPKYNLLSQIDGYRLVLQHFGSTSPALDVVVPASQNTYTDTACGAFVIDSNLTNWTWQVSAVKGGSSKGDSELRPISFAPCRLANGAPCTAPAP